MIQFDILTLFPEMFAGVFDTSIIGRAQERGFVDIALHNIRDYAPGKHRVTDDTPYGGGGGMLMKPEPIFRAVETVLSRPAGWSLGMIALSSTTFGIGILGFSRKHGGDYNRSGILGS